LIANLESCVWPPDLNVAVDAVEIELRDSASTGLESTTMSDDRVVSLGRCRYPLGMAAMSVKNGSKLVVQLIRQAEAAASSPCQRCLR
jgi:hypothetical protein